VEGWLRVPPIYACFGYIADVVWNLVVPMELVTVGWNGSVQGWKMSIDEVKGVVFKMAWGASLGTL
jgi:hypothetical protein